MLWAKGEPVIVICSLLTVAGLATLAATDRDTRRWYLTLAADVILRRTP